MDKILITGTGRCGTTFLIKLFSFLNYDTGYNKNNFQNHIFKNCDSGMEKHYTAQHYIVKSPNYIAEIDKIVKDKRIILKKVIIPIRDYKVSASSRVKHGHKAGGLWNASDETSQINYYMKIISNYIFYMTKYDVDTIFIDFDRMINDKIYLFIPFPRFIWTNLRKSNNIEH